MRKFALGLLFLGLAHSVPGATKAELDEKIHKLTARLEALQAKPDKAIPAADLRNAAGIILLESTKGGFMFAYEGGGGVALLKDPKKKTWGPAAFLAASDARK